MKPWVGRVSTTLRLVALDGPGVGDHDRVGVGVPATTELTPSLLVMVRVDWAVSVSVSVAVTVGGVGRADAVAVFAIGGTGGPRGDVPANSRVTDCPAARVATRPGVGAGIEGHPGRAGSGS